MHQQGYQAQPANPGQALQAQQTKFYKSGFFGFSSAAGRFQRDITRMERERWRVQQYAFVGTDVWFRRIIAVTYIQY